MATAPVGLLKLAMTEILWKTHVANYVEQSNSKVCRLGVDVEVRSNSMGRGLYALRDIQPGELIGRYTGEVFSFDEFEKGPSDGFYAMRLANGDVIDGGDESRSSFVRFINHSVRKTNADSVDVNWPSEEEALLSAVYIETNRFVKAGSELFIKCACFIIVAGTLASNVPLNLCGRLSSFHRWRRILGLSRITGDE